LYMLCNENASIPNINVSILKKTSHLR